MSLQEILNSDVEVIGGRLREGLSWWLSELAAMTPRPLRETRRASRPVAELGRDGETVRIWRNGTFVERTPGEPARPMTADLGLPPGAVLMRELVLPPLQAADLKRLIANDLDRLTPFRPEQVYFDVELLERDEDRSRQAVRLAVVPRVEAEAALERAERLRISPQRLGVLGEDRRLQFDFLEPMRAAGHGGRIDRRVTWWWATAAVLAALNVAVLIFKDMDDIAALKSAVELQAPTVTLATSLRRRVEAETASRAALLGRRDHNEPLQVLSAAAKAFPPPQWIQRLEWNGHAVRLVGYSDPGFDVLAAMARVPELAQPRQMTSGEAAAAGARRPFDVVAAPAADKHR
jgi:general secretion pathway protein L